MVPRDQRTSSASLAVSTKGRGNGSSPSTVAPLPRSAPSSSLVSTRCRSMPDSRTVACSNCTRGSAIASATLSWSGLSGDCLLLRSRRLARAMRAASKRSARAASGSCASSSRISASGLVTSPQTAPGRQ